MKNYKASVITAVGKLKHYENFINRYYENLIQQTIFEDLEIIIVYVEWHSVFENWKKHHNVKFILDNEGNGMYNAWNIGIKNSTSPYLTNWNIDDIRFYDNIEKKINILNENKNIDLVYNWYTVTKDISENYENFDFSKDRYVEAYPDNAHEFVFHACMCGPDPLWRKEIHDSIGYFDLNFPCIADWEMWIRMAYNGYKFILLPEILCIFYENENSTSNRLTESREKIEKQLLFSKYRENFINPKLASWQKIMISNK